MRRVAFVVPGPLDAATGGSRYDRMIVAGLRAQGWLVDVRELPGAFPLPERAAQADLAAALQSIPDRSVVVVDGLVLGALPDVIEAHAHRLAIVGLVHLPLAADITLDPASAPARMAAERRALTACARVVVTGRTTLEWLAAHGVRSDPPPIVIEPGTAPRTLARGSAGGLLELLCVATVHPGKGHRILLDALSRVGRAWHLTCAGSLVRHGAARDIVALARRLGLEGCVTFTGELDDERLAARYDGADVFVLATLQETWGMAVAEALAHGLPVVSTTVGAIPDLVGSEAGLLVPPGDAAALGAALDRIVGDASLRSRLAAGAHRVRERLPTPEQAVSRWIAMLERLPAHV